MFIHFLAICPLQVAVAGGRCLLIKFLPIPGNVSNSSGRRDSALNTDDTGGNQATGDGMSQSLVLCWFL